MTATALIADDEALLRAQLRRSSRACRPELEDRRRVGSTARRGRSDRRAPAPPLLPRHPHARASGLDVARAASGRCHVVFVTATTSTRSTPSTPARSTTCSSRCPRRGSPPPWRGCGRVQTASPAPPLDALVDRLAEQLARPRSACEPASRSLAERERRRHDQDVRHRRGAVLPVRREVHARRHRRRRGARSQVAQGDRRGAGPRRVLAGAPRRRRARVGGRPRAARRTRARSRCTEHHPEKLSVSQAYAWRFKPM